MDWNTFLLPFTYREPFIYISLLRDHFFHHTGELIFFGGVGVRWISELFSASWPFLVRRRRETKLACLLTFPCFTSPYFCRRSLLVSVPSWYCVIKFSYSIWPALEGRQTDYPTFTLLYPTSTANLQIALTLSLSLFPFSLSLGRCCLKTTGARGLENRNHRGTSSHHILRVVMTYSESRKERNNNVFTTTGFSSPPFSPSTLLAIKNLIFQYFFSVVYAF